MEMRELQERAARFTEANRMEASPETRLLDLVAEVGEAAKELLRSTEYGRSDLRPAKAGEGIGGRPLMPGLPRQQDRGGPGLEWNPARRFRSGAEPELTRIFSV